MDNLKEESFNDWIEYMIKTNIPKTLSESAKEEYKRNLIRKVNYLKNEYNKQKKELIEGLETTTNTDIEQRMREKFFTPENIAKFLDSFRKIDEKDRIVEKLQKQVDDVERE